MSLDRQCYLEHIAAPAFRHGVARGWWDTLAHPAILWPHALIWIAAPSRPNSPDRYHLLFFLKNYPDKGPTAVPWDPERNQKLALSKWPKGVGDVEMVFRTNWNNAVCLYAPWDRLAMESHPDWPAKHPGLEWKPTRTIAHYLRHTYELLASDDYRGQ